VRKKARFLVIYIFFACLASYFIISVFTGCRTAEPVIVDTGDIQRLQSQLEYYRGELNRIQSENQRLTERSLEMAKRNSEVAERVNQASRELQSLGASTLDEVSKLRKYVAILERFFSDIDAGKHGERRQDIEAGGG